eukprot:TRINITY_DN2188_c0_g1_i1.p1 TRINITY_DN2188_c0_g1~~TRINITY_DN2188_c0_g1_i1.p1  ORF type:complete len:740 (-),score=160.82 TRINITY_DN2188_c0_g1_i1:432-2651(-)
MSLLKSRSFLSGTPPSLSVDSPALQQCHFLPYKGVVWKWTNFVKGWRSRYFIASVPGVLEYYSSNRAKRKLATISLVDAIISPSRAKEDQFSITLKKKSFHMRLPTREERDRWVEILLASKELYQRTVTSLKPASVPTQSPEITELQERLQELQGHKTKFIAQIRQLKISNKQSAALLEDLAAELVLTVEECNRIFQKSMSTRSRSVSKRSMNDDDDISFYSCVDRSDDEDDDDDDEEDSTESNSSDGSDGEDRFPSVTSPSRGRRSSFISEPPSSPLNPSRLETSKSDFKESRKESSKEAKRDSFRESAKDAKKEAQKEQVKENDLISASGSAPTSTSTSASTKKWIPVMKGPRRQKLPHPKAAKRASLWGVLKDSVGKDLSRITLPASWNEPLGTLQRACEEMENHDLIKKALEIQDPLQRMLHVAAFAVSAYGYTENRTSKPFNPMLGESYEFEDEEIRFISEQVSHHPPITAFHTQGHDFQIFGEILIKNKFWGKSVELNPVGAINVVFEDTNHRFSWSKVNTTIHNIVIGTLWLSHAGEMKITNHATGDICTIEFHKKGWFDSTTYLITGQVYNRTGDVVYHIYGMWNEYISYLPASAGHDPNNPDAPWIHLWGVRPFPPNHEQYYNFSYFSMKLNEITPELRAALPANDSRLRPDQRLLEDGDYDRATEEKLRLEEKQREMRRARERAGEEWNPRWFQKTYDPLLDTEIWAYKGEYWQCRDDKDWKRVVDLFA